MSEAGRFVHLGRLGVDDLKLTWAGARLRRLGNLLEFPVVNFELGHVVIAVWCTAGCGKLCREKPLTHHVDTGAAI